MNTQRFIPGDVVEIPGRFKDLIVRELRKGYVYADFASGYGWVSMPEDCFVLVQPYQGQARDNVCT